MQLYNSKGKANSAKKIAFCGMFTALAVIMAYVESFINIPGLLPGMKLGLANSVIIFVLMGWGLKEAMLVSILRIIINSSMFGNLTWAAFSIVGAVFSIIVMWLIKKTKRFSMLGMSMAGGVAHNLGQTIVAIIIFENLGMIYYFPVLILFGVGAGIFVGILSGIIYEKIGCKHLFGMI